MGKRGGKGRNKASRAWVLFPLFLSLSVLGIWVLFTTFADRPPELRFPDVAARTVPDLPRLAVIIDDGGYRLEILGEFLKIGRPMTFSVLPDAPYARQAALMIRQEGGEVMLHLPMEPKENNRSALEKSTVKTGMAPGEIQETLRRCLNRVPHARGMNAHMGSKATEDAEVMAAVMEVLKSEGLYYIDSRTTPASAGMTAAKAMRVPFARNGKFIDAVREEENIRDALRAAAIKAKEEGKAVAIGHPDPLTLRLLREMVPEIEKTGIRFVFASEIVGR